MVEVGMKERRGTVEDLKAGRRLTSGLSIPTSPELNSSSIQSAAD